MKKKVLTIIQVLVTVGILVWVFHDPEQRAKMWNALIHAKPSWLLAGFLCYGVVEVLAAARWYMLLRVQDVNLPIWRVAALLMVGLFFNMFMPGGVGGDVLKIVYLVKEIPDQKAKGMLAVLMDRIIGLMGLILISSVIIGMRYNWLITDPVSRHLTWLLLMILICSLGGIAFSFLISGFGLAHKLPAKMPMRDKLIDLAVAYNAYARAWPASLASLFASFGVHIASFSLYICAARALSVHVSTLELLTVMPIILTVASLPISVGGNGVREWLFFALLGPLCAVSKPEATALSLTGYVLTVAWCLIGGIIYMFYRPTQHVKIRDAEQQVHDLEHEIAEAEAEIEMKQDLAGDGKAE